MQGGHRWDLEEAGTARATALTSVVVMLQTAEAPEAMDEVQATEEAKGSIIELLLVLEERAKGDHAEGMSWQ